jgi:hypothetical protein
VTPDPTGPLTLRELRALGAAYLQRANTHMEHARRHPGGGAAYEPLPETAAEHAGQYLLSEGSVARALAALDAQLRGASGHENRAHWEAARALLLAAADAAPR